MSIALQLGHPSNVLDPVLDVARASRANDLIAQLNAIDVALTAARIDSMATAVGELKVNYAQHIGLLKAEGSRLLKELSNLTGLAVAYDRFSGQSPITVRRSPWGFQSYW